MVNNTKSEKTIFEKIVSGEIPSHKIYEDNDTYAFLDISPDSRGHAIVIPKKSYADIHEIPTEILRKLIVSVQKISNVIKKHTKADGIKIIMNNGEAAGQIVFHAHIHIIPKFKHNDIFQKFEYKKGEAEELALKISKDFSI